MVALERRIEGQLYKALGYEVKVFIRTESQLAALARYKPFKASQLKSALAFNVGFLSESVTGKAKKTIMAMKSEADDFHVCGREVFWLCKAKQSDSKFSNARFEKALNTRATWRNVNTVARLAAKYPEK
jgi:uncharacterized protein (DUF1697 family)